LRLVLNDIKLKFVDDVSSIRYKRPHPTFTKRAQ